MGKPRKPLDDPNKRMRRKGTHHSVTKDDAIREIVKMMTSHQWKVGESHLKIAEKYKVTYDTVCHWSANASRLIRMARGDDQEIKQAILRAIDEGAALARSAETLAFDQKKGDFVAKRQANLKALRDFVQLQADVHGLTAPAHPQETSTGSQSVNLDELRSLLNDLGFEITPKKKKDSDGKAPKRTKRKRKPNDDSGNDPNEAA